MVEHSDLWTELGMLHQMILQDFMKCRKNCTKKQAKPQTQRDCHLSKRAYNDIHAALALEP